MTRNVQYIAAIGLAIGLLGSTAMTSLLAASAGRHQLLYTAGAMPGMTREEAVGVALGAFRGMFVNMLWMRANDLKQAGKYRSQYVYRCSRCAAIAIPYAWPAASAIDWSLPAPRIGDRRKPLADATMRRIRAGLERGHPLSIRFHPDALARVPAPALIGAQRKGGRITHGRTRPGPRNRDDDVQAR